jgi:hypothetical protein
MYPTVAAVGDPEPGLRAMSTWPNNALAEVRHQNRDELRLAFPVNDGLKLPIRGMATLR